jgi:hypothetical protein
LCKECWRPVYGAGAEGNQKKKNVVERKASVLMEIKRE